MSKAKYAPDKPGTCARCSFWNSESAGCSLGTANCYYLLEPESNVPRICVNCPYIRDGVCIGICYKLLLPKVWR